MTMRIGITQREVGARDYHEPRDALAQDWAKFMRLALPGVPWLPIPNVGTEAPSFAVSWSLSGLILSGGETPGDAPRRDATEAALIEHARHNQFPIFAVCRGLLMLAVHAGLELNSCDSKRHVARRHALAVESDQFVLPKVVNSFHANTITAPLPYDWTVLAKAAEDGSIEAVCLDEGRTIAVMWHPEREETPSAADVALFRRLFRSAL
jgi:N5-(cytidine 5'-diphosphoramidyl)-L-glutamine hydrolase